MPLSAANRFAVWGDLFEVAVKRGCLALLRHRKQLPDDTPLSAWRDLRVEELHRHLFRQFQSIDPSEQRRLSSTLDQLQLEGWALGYTTLREVLRREDGEVEALFCPLHLPDRLHPTVQRDSPLPAFWRALHMPGTAGPDWEYSGEPANTDFLAVLQGSKKPVLVVLEFSLQAPGESDDFSQGQAHLVRLRHTVSRLEGRGVFTRIGASVLGEEFALTDAVIAHLPALTSSDKPLYKLCQGASYATRLIDRCPDRFGSARARVVAVTSVGLEGIAAQFDPSAHDVRARLMRELGNAYRACVHLDDDDEQAVNREIEAVRRELARALPRAFRQSLAAAFNSVDPSAPLDVRLDEQLSNFVNPAAAANREALLAGVEEDEIVQTIFGPDPRGRLAQCLGEQATTLRNIHGVAIGAALRTAKTGEFLVIAAEGHPGIGKTQAVMEALKSADDGYLWLYASPRLVINSDVTQKMARTAHTPTGVLTMTTNQRLITGARKRGRDPVRGFVEGAVVVDGVSDFVSPVGGIRYVSPTTAQQLDAEHGGPGMRKVVQSERLDRIEADAAPGVLATLAKATREAMRANPGMDRIVLTAAIQGFRTLPQRGQMERAHSTVRNLSQLFNSKSATPQGRQERRSLAAHIPTMVVMVDEIAGDGAGAPFVHALAEWLDAEFVEPFRSVGQRTPFRVILILADASLSNDTVLGAYLAGHETAPEKVLVSPSHGPRPFRVAGTTLRVGGIRVPVLHVMADGFPASSLQVAYHIRVDALMRSISAEGATVSKRRAIAEEYGERILRGALHEIAAALRATPHGQQVICFVQNREMLRDLRNLILEQHPFAGTDQGEIDLSDVALRPDQVGLLDSSISHAERTQLIDPEVRDRKRLLLMTSSGARGVSFPRATTIIAFVPTFSVESAFMEIAQLIYRGRGMGIDPQTGQEASGDFLARRLVLVLHDIVVADGEIDRRQWLRRTVDILSALVLLRATVLSRITGDAAIPGQQACVVPVGRIGTEELVLSISDAVRRFRRESGIYLHDPIPPDRRVLVEGARDAIDAVFRNARWEGNLPDRTRRSIATASDLSSIAARVCSPSAALLDADGGPALPERTYVVGPLWLEQWDDVESHESFEVGVATARDQEQVKQLRGRLAVIARKRELGLPEALRRAARAVHEILDRPEFLESRTYTVDRPIASTRVWVALPLAYHRFCSPNEEGQSPEVEEPEQWLESMLRAVEVSATLSAYSPVLPIYRERPFLAFLTSGDPTGMERVFDDRYFMASAELNLLNTILFAGEARDSAETADRGAVRYGSHRASA